jgi:hypothetical protein
MLGRVRLHVRRLAVSLLHRDGLVLGVDEVGTVITSSSKTKYYRTREERNGRRKRVRSKGSRRREREAFE